MNQAITNIRSLNDVDIVSVVSYSNGIKAGIAEYCGVKLFFDSIEDGEYRIFKFYTPDDASWLLIDETVSSCGFTTTINNFSDDHVYLVVLPVSMRDEWCVHSIRVLIDRL